ncbi:hypothetical protein [Nitratidesulfovibrio sp.]|uniref:hypothetical protein n=1 Tax=Nitratidesulfovibrio sp. TaxID=2802297 RepID=UPI0033400DB0
MLRELTARGADEEIILATAAMHGLDDVSLAEGVKPLAVVNHYLDIGLTGLTMRAEHVRAERAIGFLADSDWPWSGRAQQRARELAEAMAPRCACPPGTCTCTLARTSVSNMSMGCCRTWAGSWPWRG